MQRILLVVLLIIGTIFGLERTVVYQGKLTNSSGVGINDVFDMQFKIYPAVSSSVVLDDILIPDVEITRGLFTVELPVELSRFELYNGMWLEITIDGDVMYPRQKIESNIFSMAAWYADTARFALSSDVSDSVSTRRVHYSDTTGAVNWADIREIPDDLGGFNRLRAEGGSWLEDSLTLVGGTGMSLLQVGDTVIFTGISDSLYIQNQDSMPQLRSDFWIDGTGIFGEEPDQVVITSGDVSANSITLGGVTLTDWSGVLDCDTLSTELTDTIVVMENMKIYRELIADSVQAVGDTVFVDDNLKAHCARFQSEWARDFLLDESFSSPDFPPTGWSIDSTNEGQYTWHRSTGEFFSTPAAAGIVADTEEQNERLSTPELSIPGTGNYYLTYTTSVYYGFDDPGELHEHLVEVSTNGGISWSVIVEYRDSLPVGLDEWTGVHSVDLSPYAGMDIVLSFHTACPAGIYHDWYIDDVAVFSFVGDVPAGVDICDGNVNVDGDINLDGDLTTAGIWLDGEYIDNWDAVSGGEVRFDTLNATSHDVVVVSEDLEVTGSIMTDWIFSAGDTVKLYDWLSVRGGLRTDSIELGGEIRTEWPDMTPDLDDAYNNFGGGTARIDVDAGRLQMIGGDSQTLYIRNGSDSDEALRVYNSGDGPAIYSGGDLELSSSSSTRIFSTSGINIQLDKGGNDFLHERFSIMDHDAQDTVFRIDELGFADISTKLSAPFADLDSIRLGGVTRNSWPAGSGGADTDWTRSVNYVYTYNVGDSVGIGTTSPSSKVHIIGETGDYETLLRVENSATGSDDVYTGHFTATDVGDGYGTAVFGVANKVGVRGDAQGAGPFEYVGVLGRSDGFSTGTNIGVKGYADNSSNLDIGVYGTAPGSLGDSWAGYFVENVWVGGYLQTGGIHDGSGTGTAGYVLTADGSGGVEWLPSSAATDADWTVSGVNMSSTVSGNVGIGTSSPTHKLHLAGDDNDVLRIEGVEGSFNHGGKINFGDGDWTYISEAEDDVLLLYANTTYFDVLDGVGINTATPAYTLDIVGDIAVSGGLYDGAGMGTLGQVLTSDGSGNMSWEDPISGTDGDWTVLGTDVYSAVSGNVGIGTPAPSSKLHVADDVRIDGGLHDGSSTGTADQILIADGSGGFAWQDNPAATNLQEAYDAGQTINVGVNEVEISKITPESDRLLDIVGNDPDDEVVRIYNMHTDGTALFCSGNLRMNAADYIVSRADLKFIIDYAGTTTTVNKFRIYDHDVNEIFSVEETGEVYITGGIHDGIGTGSMNQVLTADGFGNMGWADLPSAPEVRFDTLMGTAHDTIVANSDFKVVGELIADSIQAVGDIIYLDDSISVAGAIDLPNSDYGSPATPMQTSRTDWEVADVITVGTENADFSDLFNAIVYAQTHAPLVIEIAPGTYTLSSGFSLVNVSLKGSGSGVTTITGEGMIQLSECEVSDIHFEVPVEFFPVKVYQCSFSGADKSFRFIDCDIHGSHFSDMSSLSFEYHTRVHDSRILTAATCQRDSVRLFSCFVDAPLNLVSVTEAGTQFIEGCDLERTIGVYGPTVFITSSRIHGTVLIDEGNVTLEGNYFIGNEIPSVLMTEGDTLHLLNNDFMDPLMALSATNAAEIVCKGNVIKGGGYMSIGISIDGISGLCLVDNNTITGATNVGIELKNMPGALLGDVLVKNNTVTQCGTGLALDLAGPTVQALVVGNTLVNNMVFDLQNPGTSTVSNNVIGSYSPAGPHIGSLNTQPAGLIWNDPPPPGQSLGQLP